MSISRAALGRAAAVALSFLALPGCMETQLGVHALKSALRTMQSDSSDEAAMTTASGERLAPEIFSGAGVADWDGLATPPGVWIAHPQAESPQRVRLRNLANGRETDGVMFRRDPAMVGPAVVVSSDAAQALALAPREQAELSITALVIDAPATPPVEDGAVETAALPAPASLPPASTPAPATPAPATPAAPPPIAKSDPSPERTAPAAPPPAAENNAPVWTASVTPRPKPVSRASVAGEAYLQVGSFGVEANAAALADRLLAAGQPVRYDRRQIDGRDVGVVLIGPLTNDDAIAAARAAAAAEGIADAIEVTL
ncbi:MAG: SPOR domain-containing protein [Pikeienuella sp.]